MLQIKDSRLHFRYNLNSLRTEEKDIWLSAITVGDGQWHTAKVRKFYVSYIINNNCVEWEGKIDLEVRCYGQFESTVMFTVTKNRARIWTHWTNPAATLHCLNYELIQFLTCQLKHAREVNLCEVCSNFVWENMIMRQWKKGSCTDQSLLRREKLAHSSVRSQNYSYIITYIGGKLQ